MSKYPNDYRILFTRDDGGLSISIPTGDGTIQTNRQRIFDLHGTLELTEMGIDDYVIQHPPDRKLRNAWVLSTDRFYEDENKSREIIRNLRNKSLLLLDSCAWTETRKPNGKINDVDDKAVILRNIPQRSEFSEGNILNLKNMYDEIFFINQWAINLNKT